MRKEIITFIILTSIQSHAQNINPEFSYQQEELRQKSIEKNLKQENFTTLEFDIKRQDDENIIISDNCTPYKYLTFNSPQKKFTHYLESSAVKEKLREISPRKWGKAEDNLHKESCISHRDIHQIIQNAQNSIIDDGWITTRVMIEDSDTTLDEVKIIIVPGKINDIHEKKPSTFRTPKIFHFNQGDNLNLRDIEQNLDNIRRLNSLDAKIDIAPSTQEGYSDLLVNWSKQSQPFQFGLLTDNSGNKNTGKYLATASIIIDNLANLGDSLYFTYTNSLKSGKRLHDSNNHKHYSFSNSYYLNYTIPYQYWLLSINGSKHHYDQAIPGYSKVYHYTGDSHKLELDLANTIYRDQNKKTIMHGGIWWRKNQTFINDHEVNVQRKQLAGWQLGVKQTVYFPYGTLHGALNYKKGTRMLGAKIPAEEAVGEGTAKASIWHADMNWNMPLGENQKFLWQSDFNLQYTDKQLISSDLISLGGRNTIRGFNESQNISGDSGWYWRNTIDWRYRPSHQIYFATDMGKVWGKNTTYLQDKFISGAAIGSKGNFDYHGNWQYNVFIGTPIVKPKDIKDPDNFVVGFNFGYQW